MTLLCFDIYFPAVDRIPPVVVCSDDITPTLQIHSLNISAIGFIFTVQDRIPVKQQPVKQLCLFWVNYGMVVHFGQALLHCESLPWEPLAMYLAAIRRTLRSL